MRRRKTSGTGGKIQRHRASRSRTASKAVHQRGSVAGTKETKVAQFRRERDEALEQQAATAEVLKIISSLPSQLEPIFQTILNNCVGLCGGDRAVIWQFDGHALCLVGGKNTTPEAMTYLRQRPLELGAHNPTALAGLERRTVHEVDVFANPVYRPLIPVRTSAPRAPTVLAVPLVRQDKLLGVITIWRHGKRPFAAKQIELVETFANQAVIAIENTRLLNELRQRTSDLTESLEQQTATSEVLRIISASPGDLEPVFQAMLENATRICEARFATLWLAENEGLRAVAVQNAPPAFAEARRQSLVPPGQNTAVSRVITSKEVEQVDDIAADPAYRQRDPLRVALVELVGARTLVVVPMLKEDELVGAISIYRQEVRRFTDKQIELLKNFAAQAVIAIENARLLSELRQRTNDLSESLQQQTATADVLRIISSSLGELEPVFQAMLKNATQLCEAKFGMMYRFDGNAFHFAAEVDSPEEYVDFNRQRGAFKPIPGGQLERVMLTKEVSHIADAAAGVVTGMAARLAGARTQVIVPMLKDSDLIGAIIIYRQEVRPFTDKQIELVKNFAAQAVIAIENARLLNELRESLQQQTATSEVLSVISSSPGELEPVFQAMLENATRLCDANFGVLQLCEEEGAFRVVAMHNAPPPMLRRDGANQLFAPVLSRRQLELQHPNSRCTSSILRRRLPTGIVNLRPSASPRWLGCAR
jgi:GAF domain-containing protein